MATVYSYCLRYDGGRGPLEFSIQSGCDRVRTPEARQLPRQQAFLESNKVMFDLSYRSCSTFCRVRLNAPFRSVQCLRPRSSRAQTPYLEDEVPRSSAGCSRSCSLPVLPISRPWTHLSRHAAPDSYPTISIYQLQP